jgi:SpoVK/Ycf46/Vps4 family AAA+-type ATPase
MNGGNRKDAILYLSKAIEAQMVRIEAERDPNSLKELQETLKRVADLHKNLVASPEGAPLSRARPPLGNTSGAGASTSTHTPKGLDVSQFLMTGCATTFDHIIGHEGAKRVFIDRMIHPIKNPEFAKNFRIQSQIKFFLFGPPGTGKTELAIAASNEIGADLYALSRHELIKLCVDDPEKKVRSLFYEIRARNHEKGKPSVLFVEECSELLSKDPDGEAKNSKEERVIRAFQLELSLLRAGNREGVPPLLFIGATTRPAAIWTNMLNHFPGSVLYAGLPHKQERSRLLQRNTMSWRLAEDVNFESIAEITEGFSGRDLKVLCGRVLVEATVRTIETDCITFVTQEMFLREVSNYRPSSSAAEIAALKDWAAKYLVIAGGAGEPGTDPQQ